MKNGLSTLECLQADLLAARKIRDTLKVDTLQSVLTRISNAEAIQLDASQKNYEIHTGVGSTETTRRTLTESDIRQIIQDELRELRDAIAQMGAQPDHPYVAELIRKSDILEAYVLPLEDDPNS